VVGNHPGENGECTSLSIVTTAQIDLDDAQARTQCGRFVREVPVRNEADLLEGAARLGSEAIAAPFTDPLDVFTQIIPDPS
jgi:hypothetical protein